MAAVMVKDAEAICAPVPSFITIIAVPAADA